MKRAICLCLTAVLGACGSAEDPTHDVPSDVSVCTERMREIYQGLREYARLHGGAPQASGSELLAELIRSGVWENTPENAQKLSCPGPGAHPLPAELDYAAPGPLDGRHSAYAARDNLGHPFETFPRGGRVAVLACDNAQGMNHDGLMNVLYADGSVRVFTLSDLIAKGILEPTTTSIPIGEDSPLEDLRTLKADE